MAELTRPRSILLHAAVIVGALAMFFPFYWTVVTSLSPGTGLTSAPSLIPADPGLEAYQQLFSQLPFARVVAPETLAREIAEQFEEARARYA